MTIELHQDAEYIAEFGVGAAAESLQFPSAHAVAAGHAPGLRGQGRYLQALVRRCLQAALVRRQQEQQRQQLQLQQQQQ